MDGVRLGDLKQPTTEREFRKADQASGAGERGSAPGCRVSLAGEPPRKMMSPLVRELAAPGADQTSGRGDVPGGRDGPPVLHR